MIKGTVSFYDGSTLPIVIGTAEDIKAPRGIADLEKQGWPVDDDLKMTYKAWLAGKRQGDIPADSKFTDWVDNVAEIEIVPPRKNIEAAVAVGSMDREQADKLIAFYEANSGEAPAQPA